MTYTDNREWAIAIYEAPLRYRVRLERGLLFYGPSRNINGWFRFSLAVALKKGEKELAKKVKSEQARVRVVIDPTREAK